MVAGLSAGSPIETLGGGAGKGGHLARAPAVTGWALAAEGPVGVHAEATVEARARLAALVYVVAAVLALEAGRAGAVVVVVPVGAAGAVGAGTRGTGVDEGAVLAWGWDGKLGQPTCSIPPPLRSDSGEDGQRRMYL